MQWKSYKIEDLLDQLIGISNLYIKIKIDPNRIRKNDIPVFKGSYEKINKKLGWEPKIPIEQTLKDMFNWWLNKLSK